MSMVINTNVASLNAQRNLYSSQMNLSQALQRLSSGLRINSAKDDAAGLSISERMTAQIRGSDQAVRNANDGISLAQTAEGALTQVTANLQRIRELAVQAANGSNSTADRQALNNEASSLVAEIDRVASSTQFNGVNLLDGSFTSQAFQVGANANQTISITSIASARTNTLGVGAVASYSTTQAGAAVGGVGLATNGALTINGVAVGASATDGVSNVSATGSAIAIANAINAVAGTSGVTATVAATTVTEAAQADTSTTAATTITINGVSIGTVTVDATAGSSKSITANNFAAAVNAVSASTGVTAAVTSAGGTTVKLTAADGRNITVGGTAAELTTLGLTATTTAGTVSLASTSQNGITIGGTAAALTASGLSAGYKAAVASTSSGVSALDLTTIAGATTALGVIDSALNAINSSRASLGAYQNRFGSAVTSLQTTSENLSAARSRIRDADFAAETAALTRGQILQQAGMAMLAQANSLPNQVLTLLRG